MGYLPSKNFIAIVGSAIVVIFAGYFVNFIWEIGDREKIAVKNTVRSEINLAKETATDTDSDGLKNWEELLWKTDPEKADTDGDGVFDGKEIAEGRDPTIKRDLLSGGGWTDSFKKPEELVAEKGGATMTSELAKSFAANYFGAKGLASGSGLNTPTKDLLANSLTLSVEKGIKSYTDIFTARDIKISAETDKKSYINRLGAAMDVNFKDISSEMEVKIATNAVTGGELSKLNDLEANIAAYKKTVEFLKNEPVPPEYAALHLLLLNSMHNTSLAVENIKEMQNDPVRATIGVQLYYTEVGRSHKFLVDLKTQTQNDKITFVEGEGGAFFNEYFSKI